MSIRGLLNHLVCVCVFGRFPHKAYVVLVGLTDLFIDCILSGFLGIERVVAIIFDLSDDLGSFAGCDQMLDAYSEDIESQNIDIRRFGTPQDEFKLL